MFLLQLHVLLLVYPEFCNLFQDARFRLLMAEDTPKEIDMLLYRYYSDCRIAQAWAAMPDKYSLTLLSRGISRYSPNVSLISNAADSTSRLRVGELAASGTGPISG